MDSARFSFVWRRRAYLGVILMTFSYRGKKYLLRWQDGPLAGLEIDCGPISFGEVAEAIDEGESIENARSLREVRDIVLGKDGERGFIDTFISHIEKTNTGEPDLRSLFIRFDFKDLLSLLTVWIEAISGKYDPLTTREQEEAEESLGLT